MSSGFEPDAVELVFEYMAATQQESGRPVPAAIARLPDMLRAECENLAVAYRPPGALWVAYRDGEPVGCVGLQPGTPAGTAEVKRLYVSPPHRSRGIGHLLMEHAHRHAADHGFDRLVLDVMPSRTKAIDFYRRLGYTETSPYPREARYPMVYLERLGC